MSTTFATPETDLLFSEYVLPHLKRSALALVTLLPDMGS